MAERIQYNQVLNEAQLSAVSAPDGPILVIAGAGSGKTRTLVYRVAWLVEKGVPPGQILLLTFTRKAAREMLDRAAHMGNPRCREVSGGTFHSLAQRVLKEQAVRVGLKPSFTIMDRSDMEEAVHALIPESDCEKRTVRFPTRSTVSTILSKAVNMEKPVAEIIEGEYQQFFPLAPQIEELQRIYLQYKRRNNLVDFDDLILLFRELLRDHEDIRMILAGRYRYIMVDEYQDTNTIQADIIRHLGSIHRNVLIVGDDSQSIYSFRGAKLQNMFTFRDYFPEARVIKLEQNYRSTQPILTMANALMDQATQKYTKCLYTERKGGDAPLAVNVGTERDQASYVCRAIENFLGQGLRLRDMAILFRAAYHSFELEIELARRGIPFAKYGGFKFMESAHIKDLLAHLRVIVNRDDVLSWGRLLRLIRNIGPGKSQSIVDWMRREQVFPAQVCEWPGSGRERDGLAKLGRLMGRLCFSNVRPGEAVKLAFDYYQPFLSDRFDDFPRRQLELEQLISMAERYENLRSFLDDLSLEPPASPVEVRPLEKSDYLTLSTIHSAKGLEWKVVFIIWLIDGRFPSGKAFLSDESLEEELRLLYVAATRAKDRLFMVYPGQEAERVSEGWRGNFRGGLSSFVRALPEEVIEHHCSGPYSIYSGKNAGSLEVTGQTTACKAFLTQPLEVSTLRPGDMVKHPAFGAGVIARFLGQEKVEVIFKHKGVKLLHLGYTSLEKI